MSRHGRNPRVDYLSYLAARAVQATVGISPWWLLRGVSRVLGLLLYALGGRHRRRVLLQMRLVFGNEKTPAELDALARRSFQHLVMFLFESLRMASINKRNVSTYLEAEGFDPTPVMGRATITLSPHLGGFQQMARILAIHGVQSGIVQRPLDNPYIDEMVQRQRAADGIRYLSKFDNLLKLREFVREKRVIGLVIDQNGGRRGIFADFLGFPASTWESPADLHFTFKIPLVIALAPRIGLGPKMRFEVRAVREYDPELGRKWRSSPENRAAINREIVEWFNAELSAAIRDYPEQWLWQHRRWKTRPKDEQIPMQDGVPCPWLVANGKGGDDDGAGADAVRTAV